MRRTVLPIAFLILAGTIYPAAAIRAETEPQAWLTSLDEALAQAAEKKRYVLIDMWAEWCGWCKVLEEEVFASPEFQEFARDVVLLRVDTMDEGEGSELQKLYRVKQLPTALLIDVERVKVGAVTGMFPVAEYLQKLRDEIAGYERIVKFYDKILDSDKVDLQRQLAAQLHERGDGLRAAKLYVKLQQTADEKSEDAAWLAYYAADAYRLNNDFARARVQVAKAQDLALRFGHATVSERADLLAYYISRNDGNCEDAEERLEEFLARHPDSESRYEARKFLRELRRGEAEGCSS